jgi:hypothetical protein
MIHGNWVPSAFKVLGKLYELLATNGLRNRSEQKARSAPTASVIRGGAVKIRWYEWPAARQLQREGHGTIRNDDHYETWVNVTPRGLVMAMELRGRWL